MTSRDFTNDELLSAYLDGEVTVEDRDWVERLLSADRNSDRLHESFEARDLLTEFRSLGDDLRKLPRHRLDESFADRVLAIARQRAGQDAVSPAAAATRRSASRQMVGRSLSWWLTTAISASVAAAVAVMLVLVWGPGRHESVAVNPGTGTSVTSPETPGTPLPGTAVPIAPVASSRNVQTDPLPMTQYLLAIEVGLSAQGLRERRCHAALKKQNIWFDESLRADRELEEALLSSRLAAQEKPEKVDPKGDLAEAQLIYVEATGPQIDGAYYELQRQDRKDTVYVRLDFLFEDKDFDLFRLMHAAAARKLAESNKKRSPGMGWDLVLSRPFRVPVAAAVPFSGALNPLLTPKPSTESSAAPAPADAPTYLVLFIVKPAGRE